MFARVFIWISLLMLVAGCGRSDRFTVKGEVKDLAGKEVRMVWYDGNGTVRSTGVHADEKGNFKLVGESENWTLVSLTDGQGCSLTNLPLKNGQSAVVSGNPGELTLKGSEPLEALSAFRAEAGHSIGRKRDSAAEAFVRANAGSVAATVVLMEDFNGLGNPALADSLFNLIAVEARPLSLVEGYSEALNHTDPHRVHVSGFSAKSLDEPVMRVKFSDSPYTLVMAVGREGSGQWGRERISEARKHNSRVRVIELTVEGDSAMWNARATAEKERDSLGKVIRLWVPGGVGYPGLKGLGLRKVPSAILADSTAKVVYAK